MAGIHPKRVLYVTHEPNLTGASRSLLDLLSALDRNEIEPTVLLRRHGPLEDELDALAVPHDVVPYVLAVKSKYKHRPSFLKVVVERLTLPRLVNYMKGKGFDLVHNNTLLVASSMAAARIANIPYVCHIRELVHESHGMAFVDEHRMRRLVAEADYTISISNAVDSRFSGWVRSGSSCVLHDGFRTSNYHLDHPPLFNSAGIRMILPGRISLGKGQLEAIEATKILLDQGLEVSLTVVGGVGDESYAAECMSFVEAHGLQHAVRFAGFQDDLRDYWGEADIALCCSREEALGRIMIEGMLAGCLLVASDCESAKEIVDHGVTGFIYKQGDPGALAQAIVFAREHPRMVSEIAGRGQRDALVSYDANSYAKRVTDIYTEVIGA